MTAALLVMFAVFAQPGAEPSGVLVSVRIELPPGGGVVFSGASTSVRFTALGATGQKIEHFDETLVVEGLERFSTKEPISRVGPFEGGSLELDDIAVTAKIGVRVLSPDGGVLGTAPPLRMRPGILTLVPPLLAILLALFTRQVILALFCAIWAGVAIADENFNLLAAFLTTADRLVDSLADHDHASIVLFSLSLAGMVGIISASGGARGLVEVISRYARTPRSGQISTWLIGILIFFDDYANALIVGNTMRPFTDRMRISREKLSFIVDATAAPIATIGVISTWTAYQVGVIQEALPEAVDIPPYQFFLHSIPYSFYSLLMIAFVFLCGFTLRDFGPMLRAERRSRETGKVLADDAQPLVDDTLGRLADDSDVPPRWHNAAIPIIAVVGITLAGIVATDGDAFRALLWAALGASAIAGALALAQGMKLTAVIASWVNGARSLFLAVIILLLAWAISSVCRNDLHTGDYVVSMTRDFLSPTLVPALTFVTAGVIAFSTGTSYGTMGILIPIVLPLSYGLCADAGMSPEAANTVGFAAVAAILGGSVFGDHCSPISDTTVLSSMASGADHVDHVRSQLPYALTVAAVALPCYLLVGFGTPIAVVLGVGLAALAVIFFILARRVDRGEGR